MQLLIALLIFIIVLQNLSFIKFLCFTCYYYIENRVICLAPRFNSKAQNFNIKLEEKINEAKINNLKFKTFLIDNDVNTINVDGKPIAIDNYMTDDGLHYTKEGYELLWKAMKCILKNL